jgi:hypothetical protein
MATTIEAILGAVQLDGGSDALLQVATRLGLVDHPGKVTELFLYTPILNERDLQST